MLTFSEALSLLKAGEDMRHAAWPKNAYVRAVAKPAGPELRKYAGRQSAPYTPTQPELFGQDWSKA